MTEPIETTPAKKPRVALLLATGFGLGYLPLAPGTWGSLLAVLISWFLAKGQWQRFNWLGTVLLEVRPEPLMFVIITSLLALTGVWASRKAATFLGRNDPQQVVIDEISGQQITYLLVMPSLLFPSGWKYLLVGFILFRVFDIWKPFPIRRLEKLPGGWGIMADDWLAGVYAAVVLWAIRWAGWIG